MAEATVPRPTNSVDPNIRNHVDPEAVQRAIREVLDRTGYAELRHLKLQREGDSLTISGRVPTYYLKQLVQRIVSDAAQTMHVSYQVHVC